jgi:putative endopeptidase
MKTLLTGAALAALLFPAAALAHEDHGHDCMDEACASVFLFETGQGRSGRSVQGVEAPRFGDWGFDLAGRDLSVRPGDDFFRHANGLAVDRMEIPSDRSSYGAFIQLRDLSENRMKAIIDGLTAREDLAPGSDEAKIADLHRAYMDEARVERLDAAPIAPILERIRALDSRRALAAYMGETQGTVGASLFSTFISGDARAPDRYAVYVGQAGIGLPTRDYYSDARHAEILAKYRAYVQQMLTLAGWDDPAGAADAILAFETRIAEAHWSLEDSRDRDRTYNARTPAELALQAPGFDWDAYLAALGLGRAERLVARQDTALSAIAAVFADTPLSTLRAWQAFHTVDQAAPLLSRRFSDAQWGFRLRDLSGQPEQRSRDMRAVAFVEGGVGEALGRLYAAEYFPPESRAKMEDLVDNLIEAMALRIERLEWMGPQTRAEARAKLDQFTVKIGYPDRWRDYSALEVRADDLFGAAQAIGRFQWEYRLNRLDEPVDKLEWAMTPQTVNAYYNSVNNEIVFPAAILQPPFFDPEADPAVNYGGIGAVIGHEIGHGFDDQGRKSDGAGTLRDWWTAEDAAAFTALTDRIDAQYAQYAPLEGHNLRPGLTRGENIGDFAGVSLALEAYRLSLDGQAAPVLDGLSGEQRLFYGWAQVWRSKYREEAMIQQVASGPHSPPQFRVIGPLRNEDAWYEAFDVEPGDAYHLAPEERVRLW